MGSSFKNKNMKEFTKIAQKISKKVLQSQFKENNSEYYISFEISSSGNMIELRIHSKETHETIEFYGIYCLNLFSFSEFEKYYDKDYTEKVEANFLYQIKEMEKLLDKYI
jgi:hypothetical protein